MGVYLTLILIAMTVFLIVAGLLGTVMFDQRQRQRLARLRRHALSRPRSELEQIRDRLRQRKSPRTRASGLGYAALKALLSERLVKAGLALEPERVLVLLVLAAAGIAAALTLFLRLPVIVSAPIGLAAGWLSLTLILDIAWNRRANKFTEGLPDALDTFTRGLRAGRPVTDSIRVVAENASGPAREEFARASEEIQLGVALPDALEGVRRRLRTEEAHFIAVATSLQLETGGNLIETLDNLAEVLRERRKLKRKIRALSAEVRVSGYILGALPFVVAIILLVMSPNYLTKLLTDPRGHMMLAYGAVSLILGAFSMHRMAKLEV
ncbi:type II secretion system F family protein [Thioclava sp. BHET1]|nr:type II secretion system F family protein [Thioclava sp. BHET1]